MKCFTCKSGFIYNENAFNCTPMKINLPKEVSLEIENNAFFWVFLGILILAIICALLLLCKDKIFGKCSHGITNIDVEGRKPKKDEESQDKEEDKDKLNNSDE